MKIAHVLWTQFPVVGYGGTERVCYWLAKAQAELGHEVFVLCKPGSKLPFAKTISLPEDLKDIDSYLPKGVDIVQLYGTPNFKISSPYLVNIGGNGKAGEKFPANTVFVSKNHAERHNWTEYVHNGLDPAEYPFQSRKDTYLLFLAKASWRVKNLKGAIKIAQSSGFPLYVGGGRAGFWNRGVVSHGQVDGETKLRLLKQARALLFPIIWDEPFGLAVIEALACGTPVVATPRGSLPEIIDPSCGILADTFADLVEACKVVNKISPEACRQRVMDHFTYIHMANKYQAYYQKILSDGVLREGFPQAAPDADPQKKIYYEGYKKQKVKAL